MKLIYAHDNPALVGLAKGLLENAGLEVTIKNEFSSAGFPPYNLRQELWLMDDTDLDKATAVLEEMSEEDAQDS